MTSLKESFSLRKISQKLFTDSERVSLEKNQMAFLELTSSGQKTIPFKKGSEFTVKFTAKFSRSPVPFEIRSYKCWQFVHVVKSLKFWIFFPVLLIRLLIQNSGN